MESKFQSIIVFIHLSNLRSYGRLMGVGEKSANSAGLKHNDFQWSFFVILMTLSHHLTVFNTFTIKNTTFKSQDALDIF